MYVYMNINVCMQNPYHFLNSVHAEQHHEHGPDYVYEPRTGTGGGYANTTGKPTPEHPLCS